MSKVSIFVTEIGNVGDSNDFSHGIGKDSQLFDTCPNHQVVT